MARKTKRMNPPGPSSEKSGPLAQTLSFQKGRTKKRKLTPGEPHTDSSSIREKLRPIEPRSESLEQLQSGAADRPAPDRLHAENHGAHDSPQRPPKKRRIGKYSDQKSGVSAKNDAHSITNCASEERRKPPSTTTSSIDSGDVGFLINKYEITTVHVISSSKIQQKIRIVLERMNTPLADAKAKPGLTVLYADAPVANKMISIVELVKKEMERAKGRWYQYSKLGSRTIELRPEGKTKKRDKQKLVEHDKTATQVSIVTPIAPHTGPGAMADGDTRGVGSAEAEDEAEEAFETMMPPQHQTALDEGTKVRSKPVMIIYIARTPAPALKDLYGEQTNS